VLIGECVRARPPQASSWRKIPPHSAGPYPGATPLNGATPGLTCYFLLWLGQVVDRGAADGLRLEVRRHPGLDGARPAAAAEAAAAGADVVVDLVLGDHGLELGQRGRRVRAVEATDRQDGVAAGRELDRGRRLSSLSGRDP